MNHVVNLEVFYPHPLERVWRAITDRRSLAAWMMDGDFEPRLGHKFHFRQSGFEGEIRGEVLELDPPKRLVYSWQSPGEPPAIVTWTLTAVRGGTSLHLKHDLLVPQIFSSPPVLLPKLASGATQIEESAMFDAISPPSTVIDSFGNYSGHLSHPSSRSQTAPSAIQLQAQWDSYLCRLIDKLNSVTASD